MKKIAILSLCFVLAIIACKEDKPKETKEVETKNSIMVPAFKSKNAYEYIEKQVAFGPRVPNSAAHKACKEWLSKELETLGAKVQLQNFESKIADGTSYKGTNIIASFNPSHLRRVLLAAHWDSRRVADHDTERKEEPILGADDGGSGVGVLLEIARLLGETPPDLGVDIVLFDVEDQGSAGGQAEDWCLGSQYWSNNPHEGYIKAKFGILLDMVGAKNAEFPKEGVSTYYAGSVVEKVWTMASMMGYSNYFQSRAYGKITDDHLYVNKIARVPMIDIINLPQNSRKTFGPHWHTHDDDMDVIDRNTLNAVGRVVTKTIYEESVGNF